MVKVRSKVQRSELCYTSAMSRFLALLVALVIPFQAVAAIAAGYCEAEPPSISHPGHHAHVTNDYVLSESELGVLQPADSAQKASATVDASLAGSHHCGISHFGCNIAMIATAADLTDGEVRRIDAAASKLTIKHGEIKHLDMPPMTMVFTAAEPGLLNNLKVGDKIRFVVEPTAGQADRHPHRACALTDHKRAACS